MARVNFILDEKLYNRLSNATVKVAQVINSSGLAFDSGKLGALATSKRTFEDYIWNECLTSSLEFFQMSQEDYTKGGFDLRSMVNAHARSSARPYMELLEQLWNAGLFSIQKAAYRINPKGVDICNVYDINEGGSVTLKTTAENYIKERATIEVTQRCKNFYDFVNTNKAELKKYFTVNEPYISIGLANWLADGTNDKLLFAEYFKELGE